MQEPGRTPAAAEPAGAPGLRRASPSGRTGSIIGLDAIRFAAALGVVLYHHAFLSWHEPASPIGVRAAIGVPVAYPDLVPFTSAGWVGVQIFFTFSGFVILLSAEGRSVTAFLRSRVLRLAPALWFFATLSLGVTLLHASLRPGALLVMYLRSLTLFPQGPWIDGVYWTLTIEVLFYAVIALMIATGMIGRLRGLSILASACLLGFYGLVVAARLDGDLPYAPAILALEQSYEARVLLLSTGPYFLVGINAYLLCRDGPDRPVLAALVASLGAGAASLWLTAEGTIAVGLYGMSPATPVVLWLASVGLLALSLRLHRSGWGSVRLDGVARRAGLATYPLYLVHNIAGAFALGLLLRAGVPPSAALAVAVALCIAVSFGFCEAVEPRLRRLLDRSLLRLPGFAQRTVAVAAVGPVLPGQEPTPDGTPVAPAPQAGAATGCSRIGR